MRGLTLTQLRNNFPHWQAVVPSEVDHNRVLKKVYREGAVPGKVSPGSILSCCASDNLRIALVTNPGVLPLRTGQKIWQILQELPPGTRVNQVLFFERKKEGGIYYQYPGSILS